MMLVLPIVGVSLASYLRTFVVPLGVTSVCVSMFVIGTQGVIMGDWFQLCLGGILAIFGIVASCLVQRKTLLKEAMVLQHIMRL